MADMMEDDGFCFACGQNNPIGLKLNFVEIAGRCWMRLWGDICFI